MISFLVGDDDGGHGEDRAMVIFTGNADKARSEGYWQHQYSGKGQIDFDQATLECYLAIVDYVSTVFNEERDASTIEQAHDVLFLKQNQGSEREQFDRELLTVWLNFANGAIEYLGLLDTDKLVFAVALARLVTVAVGLPILGLGLVVHLLRHGVAGLLKSSMACRMRFTSSPSLTHRTLGLRNGKMISTSPQSFCGPMKPRSNMAVSPSSSLSKMSEARKWVKAWHEPGASSRIALMPILLPFR